MGFTINKSWYSQFPFPMKKKEMKFFKGRANFIIISELCQCSVSHSYKQLIIPKKVEREEVDDLFCQFSS